MSQPRFRGSAGNGAQELVAFRVGHGTLSAAPGSSAAGNGFSLSLDGGATLLRRSSNSNLVGHEKGPAYPGVVKAPADSDHLLSVHRRKMLRRAANRRSAQLSRARKKTHMQDLQSENIRLQRIVDIVDSQPDLVFCTAGDGRVTFLSDRMLMATKDFPALVESKEITHINQLLVPESVQIFFEAINQLNQPDQDDNTSAVKQVIFLSSCGYSMTGALRCARLTRQVSNNHQMDEGQMNGQSGNSNNGNGSQYGSDGHQQNKRQKKSSSVDGIKDSGEMYLSAQMLVGAAAVLSALPLAASCAYDEKPESGYDKDTSSSGSVCNDLAHGIEVAEHEDEYVCVVRVRDNSPLCPGENFPTSSLSKASMRDHDRSSGQERRGSPSSGSTGSGSSGSRDTGSRSTGSSTFPVSSNETGKNSTSSETGSDDNGENGC